MEDLLVPLLHVLLESNLEICESVTGFGMKTATLSSGKTIFQLVEYSF